LQDELATGGIRLGKVSETERVAPPEGAAAQGAGGDGAAQGKRPVDSANALRSDLRPQEQHDGPGAKI